MGVIVATLDCKIDCNCVPSLSSSIQDFAHSIEGIKCIESNVVCSVSSEWLNSAPGVVFFVKGEYCDPELEDTKLVWLGDREKSSSIESNE